MLADNGGLHLRQLLLLLLLLLLALLLLLSLLVLVVVMQRGLDSGKQVGVVLSVGAGRMRELGHVARVALMCRLFFHVLQHEKQLVLRLLTRL